MAQVPDHQHGFMGDVMNLMLTPAHIMDGLSNMVNPNEYIQVVTAGGDEEWGGGMSA